MLPNQLKGIIMAKKTKKEIVEIKARFEVIRIELRAGRISYGELTELHFNAEYIDPSDVELLEAAGVLENN